MVEPLLWRRCGETGAMFAFLLFWFPFPFGFQFVSRQFSLGMSCPFGRGVRLLLSGSIAATTATLLEIAPFFMLPDPNF